MCYIRGNAMDYDNWASMPGLEDWTYLDCLPYFRKAETRDIGPNDYHGGDGPLRVTTPKAGNNELFCDGRSRRAGRLPATTSTATSRKVSPDGPHGDPGAVVPAPPAATWTWQAAPELTIVTHALTDRILFSGKRAVACSGCTATSRSAPPAAVLLCGGAIASPQILQRSGVGPADLLRSLDIDLVHHLPGVGANLQDHSRCTCSTSAEAGVAGAD